MNTYEIIWSENTPGGYQVFQKDIEAKDEITAIRTVLADPAPASLNKTLLSMVRSSPTYQRDEATEKLEWYDTVDEMPPKDTDDSYGRRYSIPVLVGNSVTGQVAWTAYRWDYDMAGWVDAALSQGDDPDDYERMYIDHWATWPECKLKGGE